MSDNFYRDFEARFRGDPALIRERLRVYEPFLKPLAAQGIAQGLDLGCGRGEWLEVLGEFGLEARGVDLDEGMLNVARNKGLAVDNMDALQALRAVPDGSLAVVSAFHLIEHLAFELFRDLVNEARRALRPGGLLILETPNPENPIVGLVNFHLDPTHVKPLPPLLTQFVTEHSGFSRSIILRLQGATPREDTADDLGSILTDVSLDYAVVAQVSGPQSFDLDAAFDRQLGHDLLSAVQRFDEASATQLLDIHARIGNLEQTVAKASATQLADIHARIGNLEQTVAKASATQLADIHARIGNLEQTVVNQNLRISTIFFRSERSWVERLLFRPSGRPVRALRRLLFHTSGKPRGIFRNWVLKPDGRPRRPFRQWMESIEYLSLPKARKASPAAPAEDLVSSVFTGVSTEVSGPRVSPRTKYFLKQLEAALPPSRRG